VKIFLAGATGAIGRRLVPLLIDAGHFVSGTTRDADKVPALKRAGAQPIVLDVLNQRALQDAVTRVKPDVIIYQVTNLPKVFNPTKLAEMIQLNSRVRIEGTRNLVAAARIAGARRLIAQSLAFAYADGPEPHAETDPIASGEGNQPSAITARGVRALEEYVLVDTKPEIEGIVLRYGRLYGPGTWTQTPNARAPLHVDAAAHAALLAVARGKPGAYNIAEDDGAVSIAMARQELGFNPAFRIRTASY
jgi:nucleoside-diphosphate-sugar epimerase